MAVPEQTPYKEYTANGSTTSFTLSFICESKNDLIVLVDGVEPPVATWSLIGANAVFTTAPASGKKIILQRNTAMSRTTNYQGNNNSFRPETINKDIDRVWLKLQELGVADMLLKIYVDRLHIEQKSYIDDQDQIIKNIISDLRNYVNQQDGSLSLDINNLRTYVNQQDTGLAQSISNLRNYTDQQDNNLKNQFDSQINQQGVSLQQLDNYYKHLLQGIANIATAKGWLASLVTDASGNNQQQINDRFIDVTLLFKEGSENAAANSAVLSSAIFAARLQKKGLYCEPRGTVHFNADADFSGIRYISFHADSVLLDNTQFVLGKDANTAQQHIIVFGSITNGTNPSNSPTPSRPLVKIFGLKQSEVKIGSCNYVQLYADSADPQTSSIAYCNIYNTGIWSLLEITDSGAPLSWITENKFYGGRAHKIHIVGVSYQHNHNKWFSTTSENATPADARVEIKFINASQNTIYDNRLESVSNAGAIYFDENSRSNQVFRTCTAGAEVRSRFDNLDRIVDDRGRGNIVLDMMNVYFDKQVIASFDATSDTVFANATYFGTDNKHVRSVRNDLIQQLIPNFNYVNVRGARQLITTDVIAARYGDCFIIEGDYVGDTANARIYCYDGNMNPILTNSAERLIDHPSVTTFDPNTGRYSAGVGIGADKLRNEVFLINDTRVKYVQVAVEFMAATTVRNILIGYFTRRGYQLGQKSTFLKSKEIVIHGLPTMGWAAVGTTLYNSRDKVKNLITFSAETLTTTSSASASNTLVLQNINGATNQDTVTGSIAAGDLLGVKLSSGAVHWSRVSAVDAGTKTVTLATALPENVISGAFVKVCRFAVESALHSYSARTVAANSTTTNSFGVPYAQLGKRVEVIYRGDAKGLVFSGSVTSEGSVAVRCQNTTTADISIDASTISINVFNS